MKLKTTVILFFYLNLTYSQEIINIDDLLVDLEKYKKESCYLNDEIYYSGILYLNNDSYDLINQVKPQNRFFKNRITEFFKDYSYPRPEAIKSIKILKAIWEF